MDGLKLLAKLLAETHRELTEQERNANVRAEQMSKNLTEFDLMRSEIEPERFETLGAVCVVREIETEG
jgi:hypothetical protein